MEGDWGSAVIRGDGRMLALPLSLSLTSLMGLGMTDPCDLEVRDQVVEDCNKEQGTEKGSRQRNDGRNVEDG
jgi:hypothetical protein